MGMRATLSACNTVEGYHSHTQWRRLARTLDHAINHLVPCETHNGIIFGINLNFSQPCKGKMFTGVSQGTKREIPSVRERERGRAEKSGRGD